MIKLSWPACCRILLVDAGIIFLSACLGVALNRAFVAGPQQSLYSYSSEGGKAEFKPLTASMGQETAEEVRLESVREIIGSKSAIPVDGRSEADFEDGHLPGAVSLSVAAFDRRFQEFKAQYPKDRTYLIYCGSGQCGLSRQLASLLQKEGYSSLKIYSAGYNDWFLSGNPIEKGKGPSAK